MIAEKIKYLKKCMDYIIIQDPEAFPLFIKYNKDGEPVFYINNQNHKFN